MEPGIRSAEGALPCDLEIRVRTPWGDGGESFEFVLNSPPEIGNFYHREVSGARIRNPEVFKERIFQKLESLQSGLDVDGHLLADSPQQDLKALGHDLFLEVFKGEMLRIYEDCRHRIRTLLITSDEPWLPWEIFHGGEGDDFFCCRFQMGRWLSGSNAPLLFKECRHALFLGGAGNLRAATDELELLKEFSTSLEGLDGFFPQSPTSRELQDYLESRRFDLVHFAGHGRHDSARVGEGSLQLEDGFFRAHHLSPDWTSRFCAVRPFVFSNACQVGRLEHSLTGIDGWAARWVQRFGCSAYLAPLWSVNDYAAARFAEIVYRQLKDGHTLGEAVLAARQDLRTHANESLAWATYCVYGHPNMRLRFGDHRPTIEPTQPTSPRIQSPATRSPSTLGQTRARPLPTPPRMPPPRSFHRPENDRPSTTRSGFYPKNTKKKRTSPIVLGGLASLLVVLLSVLGFYLSPFFEDAPPTYESASKSEEITRQDDFPPAKDPSTSDLVKDSTDTTGPGVNPSKEEPSRSGSTVESPKNTTPENTPFKSGTTHKKIYTPPPQTQPSVEKPEVPAEENSKKQIEGAPSDASPVFSPPPNPLFPVQAVVPGKVAVLVVHASTGEQDFEIGEAVAHAIGKEAPALNPFSPRLDARFAEQLRYQDYSSLPKGSRSPWGAQYLLWASSRKTPLNTASPALTSFSLDMTTRLISATDGTVVARDQQTHTGIGPSSTAALSLASERCLKDVILFLKEGNRL